MIPEMATAIPFDENNTSVSEVSTASQPNASEHTCNEHCEHARQAKVLTRKQLGQLRRRFITVVHGTVRACGHKAKFDTGKQPSNNCIDCWTAYFMSTDSQGKALVDLEAVHKLLTEQGVKALEKTYGTKFMKNFHGFLATMLKRTLPKEEGETIGA